MSFLVKIDKKIFFRKFQFLHSQTFFSSLLEAAEYAPRTAMSYLCDFLQMSRMHTNALHNAPCTLLVCKFLHQNSSSTQENFNLNKLNKNSNLNIKPLKQKIQVVSSLQPFFAILYKTHNFVISYSQD